MKKADYKEVKSKIDTGIGRSVSHVDWKSVASKSTSPTEPPFLAGNRTSASPSSSRSATLVDSSSVKVKRPEVSPCDVDEDLLSLILQILQRQIQNKDSYQAPSSLSSDAEYYTIVSSLLFEANF